MPAWEEQASSLERWAFRLVGSRDLHLNGRTEMAHHPQSGHAVSRFVSRSYCGEALTLVPSFTGGSILMFGPCTLGSTPAPGFSMIRSLS